MAMISQRWRITQRKKRSRKRVGCELGLVTASGYTERGICRDVFAALCRIKCRLKVYK